MHLVRSIAVLLLLALACCGGQSKADTIRATRTGLGTALAATNAARDTFTAWSRAHEAAIVERATSKEQGAAELAAYREKGDRVIGALAVAYTSIAAADAALSLAAVEATELGRAIGLATDALRSVLAVRSAVTALVQQTKGGT